MNIGHIDTDVHLYVRVAMLIVQNNNIVACNININASTCGSNM